jgi:hypothetical protein
MQHRLMSSNNPAPTIGFGVGLFLIKMIHDGKSGTNKVSIHSKWSRSGLFLTCLLKGSTWLLVTKGPILQLFVGKIV